MITQLEIKSFINYFITQNFLEIMKKKMLLVAVAISALTLGACVDDNESQSVTDVRTAKAEQLKSIAAMNNATAEATTKLAEADAALKTASAEAIKAQTELTKVQVELAKVNVQLQETKVEEEKVKLEELKTTLEGEQAALEETKARIAANLQRIAAELEYDLIQAKANLVNAQYNYNTQLENLSAQEQAKLGKLLMAYTTASTDLIDAKQELENLNINLAKYENDLTDLKEAKDELKIEKNKEIAELQAEIDIWKQYTGVTREDATAAYKEASTKLTSLYLTQQTSYQTYQNTYQKLHDAQDLISSTAYMNKFVTAFEDKTYGGLYISHHDINGEYFWGYSYIKNSVTTYVKLFSGYSFEEHEINPSYDDGRTMGSHFYSTYSQYYDINEDGFSTFSNALNTNITSKSAALTDAQTAYDAATVAEATAKTAAEATGATQAEIDAYAQAQQTTANKLYELNIAKSALTQAKADSTTVKDAYDYLKTESTKFSDAVKAYNEASKASTEALIQYYKDDYNYSKQGILVSTLYNIMYNSPDIASTIKSLENSVIAAQKAIDDISAITTKEQMIEKTKVDISNKEAEVAALEKEAEAAKSALDTAMK